MVESKQRHFKCKKCGKTFTNMDATIAIAKPDPTHLTYYFIHIENGCGGDIHEYDFMGKIIR